MSMRPADLSREARERFLENVSRKASYYEQEYHGCCEATLLALLESFNIPLTHLKAATGFAAGIGLRGLTCGALCGGVMAIGLIFGRSYEDYVSHDPAGKHYVALRLAKNLVDRFREQFGGTTCKEVQTRVLGRWYDLWDREQYRMFEEVGGHDSRGCPSVCGRAARLAAEIILDELSREKA